MISSDLCFLMKIPSGSIECLGEMPYFSVKKYPNAIYSVLRTISNGQKLVEIDNHINRLLNSCRKKFEDEFDTACQECLKEKFVPFITHIFSHLSITNKDMRYTTVIDRSSDDATALRGQFELICVANEILSPPLYVTVEIFFLRRLNPEVKSVEWAIQREEAELMKKT